MHVIKTDSSTSSTLLTNKLRIKPDCLIDFAAWQAKLHATIAAHPGFVSLEILSPAPPEQPEWLLVQRFYNPKDLISWRQSEIRKKLMEELTKYSIKDSNGTTEEIESTSGAAQGSVTEVFVTQVSADKQKAYCEWIAKIHQAEAKFPGFRGVYVQSPSQSHGVNWITLLQFDTPENLDRWLNSRERQKVLEEATPLISLLESHRVISSYAGWFASIAKIGGLPPVWKQTMIVLLVLFPIVMLELKYLSPLIKELNSSLATFIGNAISVTLISWPLMPLTLLSLSWWLSPKSNRHLVTITGTVLVVLLYFIEIAIFWNLF